MIVRTLVIFYHTNVHRYVEFTFFCVQIEHFMILTFTLCVVVGILTQQLDSVIAI